jgi:UDP-N-acetylmuramate: L-alanyl-gamma-D-glutamyl-meso-diaminopimelate ligase
VGDTPVKKPLGLDSAGTWQTADPNSDGSAFDVVLDGESQGRLDWKLLGKHNQQNALNALAASRHVGVPVSEGILALSNFSGVKRRLEVIYEDDHFVLYDDFAHHPTAIRATLEGLRKSIASDEILAIIEPRTHTMALGTLRSDLSHCIAAADNVIWFRGENIKWDLNEVAQASVIPARVMDKHKNLVEEILQAARAAKTQNKKCHAVIMSNGAFGGIYQSLISALNN